MDRRDAIKVLAGLGLLPFVPGGEQKMPQVGDLLHDTLVRVPNVDGRRLNQLRETLNREGAAGLLSPEGELGSDVFQRAGAPFNVLPHECAMLYMGSQTQTLSNGVNTKVVNFDDPYTLDPSTTASYTHGLKVDASSGRIYVQGVPNGTVVDIYMSVYFAAVNDSTHRTLRWKADDGSTRTKVRRNSVVDGSSVDLFMELFHTREVPSAETWYEMWVDQWSGGDLDIKGALFHVRRIR